MDQAIRNKLRSVVTQCRRLLEESVAQQLQGRYDIYATGKKDEVRAQKDVSLGHLSDEEREARQDILAHFEHILALGYKPKEALDQLIREIAFTHLNRLCAYKMMEVRDVYVGGQRFREAVSRGLKSQGFLFYLADHPEDEQRFNAGQQDEAYRRFLNWLGGTLSQEIGVLFSPTDPANRVYPPQRVLDEVLDLLNSEELKGIWSEDETIGWVYQYFTPKELRDQARKESQAPRNSYELAFRNQFFTPRYVVEFLTDNTLGRIWYEMRRGNTRLRDECRYMVRRPSEVFLRWEFGHLDNKPPFWDAVTRAEFGVLPETATWDEINPFALLINGYEEAERYGLGDCGEFANARLEAYRQTGEWEGNALELWCCLFFEQRRWRHYGYEPQGEDFGAILALYQALRRALTATTDSLGQDELLERPVFIPIRPTKDPREIKILDPACGSGHFLLYCFALLLVIYEEAWEQGTIDRAEFGLRPDPAVLPETVRLDPEVRPRSNYSGQTLDPDRAYVVVTDVADGGDGVASHEPYIIDEETRFRVPIRHRVSLRRFDYAQALREGWFTSEVGQRFIGKSGCFRFEGIPVRTEDQAYRAFRQQVPGLILRHNLHGIDIDLRCAQIAALALWLRCQRAYQEMGLKKDRPPILKGNIVCAEPMPGEEWLLDEFLKTLREDRLEALIRQVMNLPKDQRVRATRGMVESLSDLVRTVWDKMRLAGEAGSLLKVEDELLDAIRQGQEKWEERLPLFRFTEYGLSEEPKERLVQFVPGDVEGERVTFWDKAENLVRRALDEFVTFASNGRRFQRQLFVEDAEQGLGFVDLCRQHYDAVLMNPPFGEPSTPSESYLVSRYVNTSNDVYGMFTDRCLGLLQPSGLLGAITARTCFFLTSFQRWRERIALGASQPAVVADLGYGVLDTAKVENAAYCLRKTPILGERDSRLTPFIRLLADSDKSSSLLDSVTAIQSSKPSCRVFLIAPSIFSHVPGSPFSYWVESQLLNLFDRFPPFESDNRFARRGASTGDDFRRIRAWWEISPHEHGMGHKWVRFAKGGTYSPYHSDVHLVVGWDFSRATFVDFYGRTGRMTERPEASGHFFKAGLTWPRRTNSAFGPRVLPGDCIFSDKGPSIFVEKGKEYATLGLLMSKPFQKLIDLWMANADESSSGTISRSYEVGVIQRLPWPPLSQAQTARLNDLVGQIVQGVRFTDVYDETTSIFVCPLISTLGSLSETVLEQHHQSEARLARLLSHAAAVESITEEVLGLEPNQGLSDNPADARSLCSLSDREMDADFDTLYTQSIYETIRDEIEDEGGNRQIAVMSYYVSRRLEVLSQSLGTNPVNIARVARQRGLLPSGTLRGKIDDLLSYYVGIVYGRWNANVCLTAEVGKLPDPFDPLPATSPGMLQSPEGLPATRTPEGYPIRIDWGGILVDDPDHDDDIIRRVRDVLEVIWKDRAEAIEKEACEILGVADMRGYFRKPGAGGFWDDHIKRYSKSRRKAPIYWLLQSSKRNYALWVYYHRLDKDILFKALLNYVEPKIRKEDARLGELRSQKAALGPTAKGSKKLDKDIDRQEAFLSELRDFEDRLRRAANLHLDPDLNDGVVLNIAPFRELVPWKEAKSYWDDLMDGQYEWSSIAKQLREKGLVSSPAT